LLITLLAICSQLRFWSTEAQRYLTEPKTMDYVLPRCSDSLLSTNQELTACKSSLSSMTDLDLLATKMAESSAYKSNLFLVTGDIYIININKKNKKVPG